MKQSGPVKMYGPRLGKGAPAPLTAVLLLLMCWQLLRCVRRRCFPLSGGRIILHNKALHTIISQRVI